MDTPGTNGPIPTQEGGAQGPPKDEHWGTGHLLDIQIFGRKPKDLKEWVQFFWNLDIFVGKFPLLKFYLALNVLVNLNVGFIKTFLYGVSMPVAYMIFNALSGKDRK